MLAESGALKLLPLPFPFPGYHITQTWHERYTHDPARQWFRSTLLSIFREEPARPALVRTRQPLVRRTV
jgi:DNA-binding transcriptional LysR family regulator